MSIVFLRNEKDLDAGKKRGKYYADRETRPAV
jgi:hypothetical protein